MNTLRKRYQVVELGELSPESQTGAEWEHLVKNCQASGFMQSLHWAAFKREQGYRVCHAGIIDDERLVAGAIGYFSEKTNGEGIIVVPQGPVFSWDDELKSTELLSSLISFWEAAATTLGAMAVRIEPCLSPPVVRSMRNFARAPVDLLPVETMHLDLSRGEDSLLQAMHHKARYNIKLALKQNVVIEHSAVTSAAALLYQALQVTGDRDDFFVEPPSHFVRLCDHLCPAGMGEIFTARHEADLLGSALMIVYGQKATFLYGGLTNVKRNLMAGYALQWQMIKRAMQLGCINYDFFGYEENSDSSRAYANFSRFKRQFGGEVVRFVGAHDFYFIDRLADAVIKAVYELENGAS